MLERLVLADDLSGAAESAAAYLLRTTRIQVLWGSGAPDVSATAAARVVVIDSDTRHAASQAAGDIVARYAAQLQGVPAGTRVVKKVDSLLRGNIGSEVAGLASTLQSSVVLATALPSAGRTVVGGVPFVDGRPLTATDLWHAEAQPPPERVADVLTVGDHVVVPLDVVRDAVALRAALTAAAQQGVTAVCDAETDDDLDAVVAGASALANVLLVGSAALVAADARRLAPDASVSAPTEGPGVSVPASHVVVAVVGSAAPGIRHQVARLTDLGLPVLTLAPHLLLTDPHEASVRVEQAMGPRGLVIAVDQTARLDQGSARDLTAALAAASAPATDRATVLLATGGETARAVLDLLGHSTLAPFSTRAAAVTSRTPDGLVVITRPGSHGSSDSALHDALAPFATTTSSAPTELH